MSIATNFGSSASVAKWTFAGLPLRNRKSQTVRPMRQLRVDLDVDGDLRGRHDRWVDDRADRERIVDGRRAGAVGIGCVAS